LDKKRSLQVNRLSDINVTNRQIFLKSHSLERVAFFNRFGLNERPGAGRRKNYQVRPDKGK